MNTGITGASGHIGNNLVRALLAEGHSVTVFVHKDIAALEGLPVKVVKGNILSQQDVDVFATGLDVIFHLAAHIFIGHTHEKKYFRENIQATENILRTVSRLNIRLVHFSSIHAFDPFPLDEPLNEQRPLVEEDKFLYNRSKAITHRMVEDAFSSGLRGVILAPTAVLGPYDYKPSLLGEAISRLAKGKMPALIPGGYDWVDVRDIVDAALQVLKGDITGESFLLSGHWVSLKDLNRKIILLGYGGHNLKVLPVRLAYIGAPFLEIWAKLNGQKPLYTSGSVTFLSHSHRKISSQKASALLGYSARPLDDTLKDTLEWTKLHKSGKK